MQHELIKTHQAVGRTYEYTIIDHTPKSNYSEHVRYDVSCPFCALEAQFWEQSKDKLRLEFYCPACQLTWAVFVTED